MKKYFVDPNASNAFASETVHKVVLNNIDFELSDDVWDVIDDAGYRIRTYISPGLGRPIHSLDETDIIVGGLFLHSAAWE